MNKQIDYLSSIRSNMSETLTNLSISNPTITIIGSDCHWTVIEVDLQQCLLKIKYNKTTKWIRWESVNFVSPF